MSSRVQVFARVCPVKPGETACVHVPEQQQAVQVRTVSREALEPGMREEGAGAEVQEFCFDGVFPMQATQEDVFTAVGRPVLHECLKGFNGTIFAYGQTGSGKTHSLLNTGQSGHDAGLLPRLTAELFAYIAQDAAHDYRVEVAAMQVYNEQVDDLLHPSHKAGGGNDLKPWFSGEVPGLTWVGCTHAEGLDSVLSRARKNLVYAETRMNKASSRSHAIFQIKLTKHAHANVLESTCARLCVVDLAGSERVKKSGVQGVHFKEAAAINASLLALGNVVNALATRRSFVPYRDSRLTHILSPAIGANCKTTLLLCASPAADHVQETMCSLEFASRAMHIEVNARVNRLVEAQINNVIQHPVEASAVQNPQVDELELARQALAEATARAEAAETRAALAEEALMQATTQVQDAQVHEVAQAHAALAEATARAEAAEIRAVLAEEALMQTTARVQDAQAIAEATVRAEKAETRAAIAEDAMREASARAETAEVNLAQRSKELQQRNAALCHALAQLENLQAEMQVSKAEVCQAREAGKAAEDAAAMAAQLECDLHQAQVDASSKVAVAEEQMARAVREAELLAAQRAALQSSYERRRQELVDDIDQDRQALAAQRKSLQKQEEELASRLALVEGLEREKKLLAKQQKEVAQLHDEMKLLDRRMRNGSGPHAVGPPVLPQTLRSPTPPIKSSPALPASDRSRMPRTSSLRAASMAALSPNHSPLHSVRSRTPPPRHGGA